MGDAELPVIVVVDDDSAVLAAVARDVRSAFGREFRVQVAGSGEDALELLRRLRLQAACVALVMSDQRMPGMTGLELLAAAAPLHPSARRVLLTAYVDSDVAIHGINDIRLDHYLIKPWDPPEEHLYPVLAELLEAWQAEQLPRERGIRLVGHAWSPRAHELRDFMARNLVPFQWLDAETDDVAGALLHAAGASATLPLVVHPDGSWQASPSIQELAARIGLRMQAAAPTYDLVVVGAGPAGLAAAMYAASEGLSTLLVERDAPGGQAGRSRRIENYLGFPAGLSGGELARRALAQARRFGAEIVSPVEAVGVRSLGDYHAVSLSDGQQVSGRALLIAAGVSYRTIDVPGAAELAGRGLYYGAAVSEAPAVRGRDVFVLGGGNSAAQAALYLARSARSVTLLVRTERLEARMSHYLVEQLGAVPNVVVRCNAELVAVVGSGHVEGVTVLDHAIGATEQLEGASLFVFIGATTRTDWLDGVVQRDAQGFILAGQQLPGGMPAGWPLRRPPLPLETSVPGIFTAGDVRARSLKGVSAAVGEGAMAVQLVRQYLGGAMLRPAAGTREAAAIAAVHGVA